MASQDMESELRTSILIALMIALCVTAVVCVFVYGLFEIKENWQPDCARAQRHVTAYRHCLQNAGQCRMQPGDFVNYYDLKHQLETQCETRD